MVFIQAVECFVLVVVHTYSLLPWHKAQSPELKQ